MAISRTVALDGAEGPGSVSKTGDSGGFVDRTVAHTAFCIHGNGTPHRHNRGGGVGGSVVTTQLTCITSHS
jgi:hypothetical protein